MKNFLKQSAVLMLAAGLLAGCATKPAPAPAAAAPQPAAAATTQAISGRC